MSAEMTAQMAQSADKAYVIHARYQIPTVVISQALRGVSNPESTRPSKGFSLLELLVVITLLGLLSLAAVVLTESSDDQMRYEDTKTRLERIKRAIIGDTARTVNGEPELSGFVADMGRLPNCVQELLEQSGNCGTSNSGVATAFTLPAWAVNTAGVEAGLGAGWRGPYLDFLPARSGTAIYLDGWGHKWSGVAQSLGKDGLPDGSDYDFDSGASLVASSDWEVLLSGWSPVTVEFRNTGNTQRSIDEESLSLFLNVPENGDYPTFATAAASYVGADFPPLNMNMVIPSATLGGGVSVVGGEAILVLREDGIPDASLSGVAGTELTVSGVGSSLRINNSVTIKLPCTTTRACTVILPAGTTCNGGGTPPCLVGDMPFIAASGDVSAPASSIVQVITGFPVSQIPVPAGKRSVVVVCGNDGNLFEGPSTTSCGTAQHRSTHYFKAVPRAVPPVPPVPLIWEIN